MFPLRGLLAPILGERGASGESDTGDQSDRCASYDSFQHAFLEAGLMQCRAKLWKYETAVLSGQERNENLSRLQFADAAAIASTWEEAQLKCPD